MYQVSVVYSSPKNNSNVYFKLPSCKNCPVIFNTMDRRNFPDNRRAQKRPEVRQVISGTPPPGMMARRDVPETRQTPARPIQEAIRQRYGNPPAPLNTFPPEVDCEPDYYSSSDDESVGDESSQLDTSEDSDYAQESIGKNNRQFPNAQMSREYVDPRNSKWQIPRRAMQIVANDKLRQRLQAETGRKTISMKNVRNVLGHFEMDEEQKKLQQEDRRQKRQRIAELQENNINRFCWSKECLITGHQHKFDDDNDERRQLEETQDVRTARNVHKIRKSSMKSRIKDRFNEFYSRIGIWQHSIKHVEGHFGTSIASYFIFIRLLFVLNFGISIIIGVFIILPQFLNSKNYTKSTNDEVAACSSYYFDNLHESETLEQQIDDFLQGRGWLEKTTMFIGGYDIGVFKFNSITYKMPLAYMLTTILFLFVSLLFMLRSLAKGFKENAITSEGHLYNYCNTVFSSWDYCINKEEPANVKKEIINTELKSCLEDEKEIRERQNRSTKDKIILYLIRFVINILILAMLGAAFFAIYQANEFTTNEFSRTRNLPVTTNQSSTTPTNANITSGETKQRKEEPNLFFEYLPSLTVTACNTFLPILFYILAKYEKYSPAFLIKINLTRTVFLRLVSIFMLLYSFNVEIEKNSRCTLTCIENDNCDKIMCWETYVGQQLYKLVLLDTVIGIVSTFGIGFMRKLLVTHVVVHVKFLSFIGREEFDIPKHVLDLVYSQTLCWLGAFFCPFIPFISFGKCFIIYYVKKFHLTVNCVPSTKPYRASKSNSFFMIVLLVSFGALVLIPITYTVAAITPSRGCSPFRSKEYSMWQTISDPMSFLEQPYNTLVNYIGTPAFAVPVIVILALFIYYNYTLTATYKKMAVELKQHLQMEGRDKQFLLTRIRQWRDGKSYSTLTPPNLQGKKRSGKPSMERHVSEFSQKEESTNYKL